MAVFTVNGQRVETKKNQKLLRFLRDELHLTSVKDGCSEGACGACTVIIDGRTCKACVPDTDLLDGRNIITVEGLTEWEEKVYTCIRKGWCRTVRLLHSWHGNVHESSSGCE